MIRDAAALLPPRPALMPRAGPPPASPPAGSPPQPLLNPRLRIDPALNLVVLEFRDRGGEISRTIPTAREIEAYRSGAAPRVAEPPARGPALDVTR